MKRRTFFLFAIIIFLLLSQVSFADESGSSASDAGVLTASEGASMQDEYPLPYPGILPDNPLYFLKAARDRLISFLISDPLKKSQFNLLEADKRLNAGVALVDKGKAKLAESTIAKGENYFEDAIAMVDLAKKQGIETSGMLSKLSKASKKHGKMLKSLEEKTKGDVQRDIKNLEKRVGGLEKRVQSLKP